MTRLRPYAYALATLLVATSGAAQEPADTQVFDHVDVSLVNVDVVVTNRRGEPVTGLTVSDFRVREDGNPIDVTNFYAATVEDWQAETQASHDPSPTSGPSTRTQDSPKATSPSVEDPDESVLLVVYVDNLRLTPHRRNSYLDQINEVIAETLRPQDRVMVVTHRDGLRVAESFTNEPAAIGQALRSIRETMGDGIRDRNERRLVLGQFRDVVELAAATDQDPCSDLYGLMTNSARSYADAARARARASLQGLSGLTSALAGAPGRKIVLYLSDGIGLYPGFDLFHLLSEVCPNQATDAIRQGQEVNLSQSLHRLASHANANRITFYTLDGTGLEGNSAADSRYAGPITLGAGTFDIRPSAQNDSIRRSNRQNTLFALANETGGRAMLNGNDLRADLAKMSRDSKTYYALGFQPAHPHDGRVHRLKVELVNPLKGVRLHYRRTYLDKTEETRTAERTLAALRFGFEDNPLNISLTTGQPLANDQGQMVVPLRIALSLGELALIGRYGFYEGKVDVVISTQDEQDRPIEMRRQLIPIRIAEDMIDVARTGEHIVEVDMPLLPGRTILAVAVRDTLATTTSFLQHQVQLESSGDLL